ncbi:MAG: phosphatase PAP2 family protein [Clostridia bacterium]
MKKYVAIAGLVLVVFLGLFIMFCTRLVGHELASFDQSIIAQVELLVQPQLTPVMSAFTFLGSATGLIILLLLTVVLMLWRKKRWEALFLVVAMAGGTIFNQVLKMIFHRERPALHRLIEESGYSFPSGHSMSAIIFYGMLAVLLVVLVKSAVAKVFLCIGAGTLIVLIGLSRIYLGVHYPSDVLAGFAAGGVWMVACLIMLKLVLEKRSGALKADSGSSNRKKS